MSGGKKSQVVGYRYYFGVHMGVGRGPVDELHEIRVGDRTAWTGRVSSNTTININRPNLFGGEEKEGGIKGTLDVMMGEPDQVASTRLQQMLGPGISGFRRMFTLFYDGIVSMNNPYPKPWKFRFNRTLKGWDGEVFAPGLAVVTVPDGLTNFTRTVLNMPLNAPGAENLGSATILHPDRFPTLLQQYPDNSMRVGDLDLGDVSIIFPDPSVGDSFWDLDAEELNDFDVFDQSIEVVDYTIGPGPISETTLAVELTQVFGTSFPYTGFFFGLQYGNYAGTPQFQIVINGPNDSTTLNIGNPPSVRLRCLVNRISESAAFFVNDALVFSGAFPGISVLPPAALRLYRVAGINASVRVRNYRLTASRISEIRAMNPAHIIYECLTNREWGRGLSRSKIDEVSFEAAATTLLGESLGLCLKWTRKDSIEAFVQLVLDHIGAVIYQSRITGLITLKLIRGDYDINSLPTLTTENGLLEIRGGERGSLAKSVNTVSVKWHDQKRDQERWVTVKNPAAIVSNGGAINSVSKDYIGIASAEIALRLAQRDLRIASTGLRRFTLVCNQSLDVVHPGDVLVIEDAKRGIPRMAVRVGKVRDGTLIDGKVTIEAVQDVFSFPATSFAVDVPNTYTPPDTTPCVSDQRTFEVPYFLLARQLSAPELDYLRDESGYFAAVAAKGKPTSEGVQVAVRTSAPTPDDDPIDDSYICEI